MNETTPLVTKKEQKHWLGIKPTPWVLYAPMLCLGLVLGMTQGPTVQFAIDLLCQRMDTANTASRSREECNADPVVQAASSTLLMQMEVVASIVGMLATVVYSNMSDKRGRRPVFLINALCLIGCILVDYMVARFSEIAPLWLLIVAAVLQGLGGSSSTLLMSCHAYCADCSTPEERTVVFGRLMASFIAGSFTGPTLAGYLMDNNGTIEPILIIAMAGLTAWALYILFILPESNRKVYEAVADDAAQSRQPFWQKFNFYSTLSIIFTAKPELSNKAALPLLILTQMLSKTANLSFMVTVVLYVTYVFAWTPTEVGYFLSFESAAQLIGLLVVIPLITKIHGKVASDEDVHDSISGRYHILQLNLRMARIGLICLAMSMFVCVLANTGWVMFLGGTLQIGGCLYIVSSKSLLVQLAGEDQAGQILGAAAVVEAFVFAAGPVLANTLYSRFVSTLPWIVFAACAGLQGFAAFLAMFIRSKSMNSIML
ncbi:hypothetical protein VKS41_003171 [Umbelopsis sp. WA50703]